MTDPTLVEKVRAWAARPPEVQRGALFNLSQWGRDRHALLDAARDFEEKTAGFHADPQTVDIKSFMGSWVRARRLYCKLSGEPLV